MEKKIWTRPMAEVETFMANEYVAASCGDSGVVYNFKCDAPAGTLYYYSSRNSDGQVDGYYTGKGSATKLGSFHPCPAAHTANKTDGFYDGYIDYNKNRTHDEGEGVIVWRGPYGNEGHATAQLDMNAWEVVKS